MRECFSTRCSRAAPRHPQLQQLLSPHSQATPKQHNMKKTPRRANQIYRAQPRPARQASIAATAMTTTMTTTTIGSAHRTMQAQRQRTASHSKAEAPVRYRHRRPANARQCVTATSDWHSGQFRASPARITVRIRSRANGHCEASAPHSMKCARILLPLWKSINNRLKKIILFINSILFFYFTATTKQLCVTVPMLHAPW